VIITCALIGRGWRHWLYPKTKKWRWLNIYLMSVSVHVVMLVCMHWLPYPDNNETIRSIALPVLVVYPITATLIGLLLMRQRDSRRLQKELIQSEERFRVLFEQAPLGYQALDGDGNIINVNQQWLDMFGYSRGEVIGKKFSDFISPEYLEEYNYKFTEFKNLGHSHCEVMILSKTGKPPYISHVGQIRYGDNGEILQSHCILQDITLQKAAQENLRESEENTGGSLKQCHKGLYTSRHVVKSYRQIPLRSASWGGHLIKCRGKHPRIPDGIQSGKTVLW
jgi:PAS domain S-box-containing protein